jgi:hypothetical protein
MPESGGPRRTRRSHRFFLLAALFLGSLAVYVFTANGHVQTTDYYQEVAVASRMVSGHGFDLPGVEPAPAGGIRPGLDGKNYSAHDLGSSLLLAPLALVPGTHRDGLPTTLLLFLSTFMTPLFAAASVPVFADLLMELGVTVRSTIIAALMYAFGSIIWPFAHISFDVTFAATFVLLAVWGIARLDRPRLQHRWAIIAGLALAWAIMIRVDAVVVAGALSVAVVYRAWRARREGEKFAGVLIAWGLPMALGACVNLWYNAQRFGSVFDSGHAGDPNTQMNGSLVSGVAGQLISPGRGLLWFSPLVVVACFGWRRLFRHNRLVTIASVCAFSSVVFVHGKLGNWSGEDTWGPRYLVPVAALSLLPLGLVVDGLRRASTTRRRVLHVGATAVITAGAFFVQSVGASTEYFFGKITDRVESGGVAPHELYWDISHAQILLQARALYRGLRGHFPYLTVSQGGRAPDEFVPVDWWWVNELVIGRYPIGAVIGATLCLVAAATAAAVLGAIWTGERGLNPSAEGTALQNQK